MFLGGSDACVWSCARWNAAYLRVYRSVERFCPVCAFAACGGGRASEMRGTDPDSSGPVRTLEVILGVLDTPDMCFKLVV